MAVAPCVALNRCPPFAAHGPRAPVKQTLDVETGRNGSRGARTFEKKPKRAARILTESLGQATQARARARGGAKKAADGIAGAPKRAAKNVTARPASAGIAVGDVGAAGNIVLLTIGLSLLASGLAGAFALYWLSKRPFSRWGPG